MKNAWFAAGVYLLDQPCMKMMPLIKNLANGFGSDMDGYFILGRRGGGNKCDDWDYYCHDKEMEPTILN